MKNNTKFNIKKMKNTHQQTCKAQIQNPKLIKHEKLENQKK